jgi:hypothetical protein
MTRTSVKNRGGIDEDAKLYGQLKEGLHLTGYTFARACSHLETLLKGNRWKFGGRFKDINAFLASVQLDDDLRASVEQRQRLAKLIKSLQPAASNRIGATTVRRDTAPHGAPGSKKASQNKGRKDDTAPNGARGSDLSGAAAAKIVERRQNDTVRTQQRRAEREQTLGAKIIAFPDAKFGVIVADPEWHDEVYSEDTGMNRHASRHYITSDVETLKARNVEHRGG